MPRVIHCTGCNRLHLIRDELIGHKIRCDCGCIATAPDTAPHMPLATGWLDSGLFLGSAVMLLLVSLLIGGGVAAWVVMDHEVVGKEPVAVAPQQAPPTAPEKPRASPREQGQEKEKKKDGDRPRPPESPVLHVPGALGPRTYSEKELYERLLSSVVLIYHSDGKYVYTGSGSVIHRGRRLIITNQHVVQKEVEDANGKPVGHEVVARVEVLFPQRGEQGELITDKKYYESLRDRHQTQTARVLGTSADPDLAILQLESDFPQGTRALELAPQPTSAGEKIVLVGNSGLSSGVFGIAPGHVKTRIPKIVIEDQVVKSTWCLETHLPSYQGDSGSPVVNYQGQIVGVHFGGHPRSQVLKYAADRNEVLTFVQKFQVKPEEVVASDRLPPPGARVLDLIKRLEDADLEPCRKAVEELSRMDPFEARRAIPALVRALHRHAQADFRRLATEELERIGPPVKEDMTCLAPAMRIPYKPLRLYVVHALSQLGLDARQAVPVLVLGLKDSDGEVRQKAALVVKGLGKKARALAFAPLLTLANDADEEVAEAGLDALLELGSLTEAEISILIEALEDGKRRVWVRRFSAHRLGLQGEKAARAVPALSKVLTTDKDLNLLSLAIGALQRIGDKSATAGAALVALIVSHPEEKIRAQALAALDALDLSAFSTQQMLECSIAEKSEVMRQAIAKRLGVRLGQLKPEQMKEFLPLFHHKEPAIIHAALEIVVAKKRDAAPLAAELAGLVTHSDARVRRLALDALQGIGTAGKTAVPPLLEALAKTSREQQLALAVTLATIEARDARVVEALLPVLLAGLHPRMQKPGLPSLNQINKVLVLIGQPAVDEIIKLFATISYRGKDNIDHRKHLFLALAKLGPECKSRENYDRVKQLRNQEIPQKYRDVLDAGQKALREMDPD